MSGGQAYQGLTPEEQARRKQEMDSTYNRALNRPTAAQFSPTVGAGNYNLFQTLTGRPSNSMVNYTPVQSGNNPVQNSNPKGNNK